MKLCVGDTRTYTKIGVIRTPLHAALAQYRRRTLQVSGESCIEFCETRRPWKIPTLRVILLTTALALLNLEPANSGAVGPILAVASAGAAVSFPAGWFFYTAAAQIAADPARLPLTLTQLSVLVWVATLPWNGCRALLQRMWPYWRLLLPFLVWFYAVYLINRSEFPTPMFYAAVVGSISYIYAQKDKRRPYLLLLSLLWGLGYAAVGYWGRRLQLPVLSRTYADVLATVLVVRVGSGRGDANMVGLSLAVFMTGCLALSAFAWTEFPPRLPRALAILSGPASVCIGLPPLLATVSRGGVYAFVLSLLVLLGCLLVPRWNPRLKRRPVGACACAFAALLATSDTARSMVMNAYQSIRLRNLANSQFYGSSSVVAGREQMWKIHWRLLLDHPLFGVGRGEFVDFGHFGSAIVGVDGTWGAAHNVFLEVGSSVGLPGLVLFLIIFLRTPWNLYRTHRGRFSAPFLLVNLSVLLLFMSLSVGNWKFYWALLALMLSATAARRKQLRVRASRSDFESVFRIQGSVGRTGRLPHG